MAAAFTPPQKKTIAIHYTHFIAKRFLTTQGDQRRDSLSAPLVVVAVATIALSVTVMIMSVSILRGFQGEITRKVAGFDSHIVVTSLESTHNAAQVCSMPISTNRDEVQRLTNTPGVRHVQYFATLPGMVKTDDQIYGIIYKGISNNYDTTFLSQCITAGCMPRCDTDSSNSNDVMVSSTIAAKLRLKVGDKLRTYFLHDDSYRARAFRICGIYKSDFSEFDDHYVVGRIGTVQRLCDWERDEVEGYEVLVEQPQSGSLSATMQQITSVASDIAYGLRYDLTIATLIEQNPQTFAWLELLNSNIVLILGIMALVCVVAIISALLIIIFEKSSTIGLLKTLGAKNGDIRRIFLIKCAELIGKGVVIGDGIALTLCLVQKYFHLIPLDSEAYYMPYVPISLDWQPIVIISLCTMAVCVVSLLLPATYIAKIEPAKAMKIE